jgi:glutamate dehydrogenase/leucine dehydrogenase
LEASDVFIIPDILCNAGGVFVSYLEYMQETQREQMTLDIVESRLRERMMQRFTDVLAFAKQRRCSPRVAAMDLAIARVAQGMRARGMRP